MEIVLKPIGYIRTSVPDEVIRSTIDTSSIEGYIEVLEEYKEGLRGLEGFSHIIVVAYLHKIPEEARKTLVVKPRRLVRLGFKLEELPEIGVFACDSPHRPNPLGISILKVEKIEGNKIYVRGLDLFNETPVLDIKPYDRGRIIQDIRVPEWLQRLEEKIKGRVGRELTP